MHATEFQISPVQPSLPFIAALGHVCSAPAEPFQDCAPQPRRGRCGIAPQSRLIRSVVEGAGLGRFVYLQGKSGRRYVFSSISNEQVALYDRALFAATRVDLHGVEIADRINELTDSAGTLYVHLLDDCDGDGAETLADLCNA